MTMSWSSCFVYGKATWTSVFKSLCSPKLTLHLPPSTNTSVPAASQPQASPAPEMNLSSTHHYHTPQTPHTEATADTRTHPRLGPGSRRTCRRASVMGDRQQWIVLLAGCLLTRGLPLNPRKAKHHRHRLPKRSQIIRNAHQELVLMLISPDPDESDDQDDEVYHESTTEMDIANEHSVFLLNEVFFGKGSVLSRWGGRGCADIKSQDH